MSCAFDDRISLCGRRSVSGGGGADPGETVRPHFSVCDRAGARYGADSSAAGKCNGLQLCRAAGEERKAVRCSARRSDGVFFAGSSAGGSAGSGTLCGETRVSRLFSFAHKAAYRRDRAVYTVHGFFRVRRSHYLQLLAVCRGVDGGVDQAASPAKGRKTNSVYFPCARV